MIAIPTSFELGGRKWKVVLIPELDDLGNCDGHAATIRIRSGMEVEETHHTFYHELCHAFCFTLGWEELNADEGKIDALGGMLFQFLKRKKGKLT